MIYLLDNTRIAPEDIQKMPHLIKHIENKTLGQLEKEGLFVIPKTIAEVDDLSEDAFVIQCINHYYQTSNVMGLIGHDTETLAIHSRFDTNEAPYFFHYMLEKVLHLPTQIKGKTGWQKEPAGVQMLLFMFPYYLHRAWEKGCFKMYTKKQYNESAIKGTLDISRHIKMNTPFIGNVAYSKRELSYDNAMTQLIRHTIEHIRMQPYGKAILQRIQQEVRAITSITPSYTKSQRKALLEYHRNHPLRHVYYSEYNELQKVCIHILSNNGQHFHAKGHPLFGFLFDGSWLWEEYINQLLGDIVYHPQNKANQGAHYLFTHHNDPVGRIFPDFISKKSTERIIADAKYKPKKNIYGRDYLQLLAYMMRFGSKTGYYFYPTKHPHESSTFYLNQGLSYEQNISKCDDITVIKHGLFIPQKVDSYSSFVDQMIQSEKQWLNTLKW